MRNQRPDYLGSPEKFDIVKSLLWKNKPFLASTLDNPKVTPVIMGNFLKLIVTGAFLKDTIIRNKQHVEEAVKVVYGSQYRLEI